MVDTTLRIGLAAVRNAPSVAERLETVKRSGRRRRGTTIVCFPGGLFPRVTRLRLSGPEHDRGRQREVLEEVRATARQHRVATVIGMEGESAAGAAQRRVRDLARR